MVVVPELVNVGVVLETTVLEVPVTVLLDTLLDSLVLVRVELEDSVVLVRVPVDVWEELVRVLLEVTVVEVRVTLELSELLVLVMLDDIDVEVRVVLEEILVLEERVVLVTESVEVRVDEEIDEVDD